MANKKLSDIQASKDPYDVRSKERLKKNMERKIKKLFGSALYLFETMLRDEMDENTFLMLHKEFKSELFRVGNRIIQNAKKELDCYNIQYVPVKIEFRTENEDE